MTAENTHRIPRDYTIDRYLLSMVLLTAGFATAVSLLIADVLAGISLESTSTQSLSLTHVTYGVGLIIAESVMIVLFYRYVLPLLPEWLTTLLKKAIVYSALIAVILAAYWVFEPVLATGAIILAGSVQLLRKFDLYWLIHNGVALTFALYATVIMAFLLSPRTVVFLLVLILAWDHIAVNKTSIMDSLVGAFGSINLPNYLIIPKRRSVDLDAVSEFLQDGDKPDDVYCVLGLGDVIFPASLAVSFVVTAETLTPQAYGTIAGIGLGAVVLTETARGTNESFPALLWLNTGAIAGAAAAHLGVYIT